MVIAIDKAQYIEDYRIKFSFSDGSERVVDFSEFLNKARNPMTRKYLTMENFRNFSIRYGDIIWNDYEMCFPVWDVYEGNI
jgi:hypothetical protein